MRRWTLSVERAATERATTEFASRALVHAVDSLGRSNAYSCRFETTRTASHLRHTSRLRNRRGHTTHLHIRSAAPSQYVGQESGEKRGGKVVTSRGSLAIALRTRDRREAGKANRSALVRVTLLCKIHRRAPSRFIYIGPISSGARLRAAPSTTTRTLEHGTMK
jgi:hypothetical protein